MKTFDLCIPAYNEAGIIADSIAAIQVALASVPDIQARIIVADNGSTDGTAEAVHAIRLDSVEVLAVPEKGKGAALICAAKHSDADFFGFIDADLSAHPDEIAKLLGALSSAQIAIGSRLLNETTVVRGPLRTLSSKLFNKARRIMLGIRVEDTQCGLKVMTARGRDMLRSCTETGWFLDLELLAHAERAGLVIAELPVAWDEFRYAGRVSKLRVLRDGFGALRAMARIRRNLHTR